MFLDEVELAVSAGKGGSGSASLHREKFVARGGPDGGDGGRGGDVVLIADPELGSLQRYQLSRSFRATSGGAGEASKRHGADGGSVLLPVPLGTLVFEADSGRMMADLDRAGSRLVVARGGRGGRGNTHFATPTFQAPRRRELGEPGEARRIRLELRLIADLGLVGLPNAGKSTLLASLTGAHPKIADYPFTTLSPNLGVAELDAGRTVTAADVPGLIEGAHLGAGLGVGFLRHLARTRVLVHVVDATLGPEGALAAYQQVREELRLHSVDLGAKPAMVALNKVDLLTPEEALAVSAKVGAGAGPGAEVLLVSAALGEGTDRLLQLADTVIKRSQTASSPAGNARDFKLYQGPRGGDRRFKVVVVDGAYRVEGVALERLVSTTDLDDESSVLRLQRQLRRLGVEAALAAAGATAGVEVEIGGAAFTFFPEAGEAAPVGPA
ncbi:MAG TPA: GTPase ObgE [Candidatus Nanopelagicaceae bacterium]|nr:GTPase ObgE [Candidatus Nanopelagicaceae bacterium]